MKEEIQDCLLSHLRQEDGSYSSRFRFPPDFVGFRGHFPDSAVLPGICAILAVQVMLEKETGRPCTLREVASARFLATVLPGENVDFLCHPAGQPDGSIRAKAVARCGERKVAELTLCFQPMS